VEWARGLKRLLKVLKARAMPTGLRPGNMISHDRHLLLVTLSVLISLIVVTLG
jgi:hypothetical protein